MESLIEGLCHVHALAAIVCCIERRLAVTTNSLTHSDEHKQSHNPPLFVNMLSDCNIHQLRNVQAVCQRLIDDLQKANEKH